MRVESLPIPGQQFHGDTLFPYALTPDDPHVTLETATDWLRESRGELLQLAARHGAVLLRGFPVSGVPDFDAFVQALEIAHFPYDRSLSNAVRVNRTERVFSANEAPPEVQIFFHHEMAQTPLFPRWILFSCEIAPESGGATPLCRSDVLLEQLQRTCPEFVAKCRRLGLTYTNVMPPENDPQSGMGRSWKSTLGVDTAEAAEERLRELGYSWQWLPEGTLKATTPRLPAVRPTGDGRAAFFNQLIAAFCGWKDARNDPSQAIRHGDGSALDADAVRTAVQLADDLAFELDWQVCDVALIDNTLVMHARRPFTGTRKVVASLGEVQDNVFATA